MASVNSNAIPFAAKGIQTIPARSSWIAAFEYDPAQMRLTTHMKDGGIYQHTFVTGGDWEALKTAQSHSSHWSRTIKGKKMGIRVKGEKSPNAEIKTGRRK